MLEASRLLKKEVRIRIALTVLESPNTTGVEVEAFPVVGRELPSEALCNASKKKSCAQDMR